MQIEADQSVCPACGAEGLEIFPVLHHMMCAYMSVHDMTSPRQPLDICVPNAGAMSSRATPLARS